MTRRKPFPMRPAAPIKIGVVQWNLDNVARHVRAGFALVQDDLVRTHYWRYLQFLQQHGYTTRSLVGELSGIGPQTTLWSTDLTLDGYRFVQYSHDRWIGRLMNYTDCVKENAYLERLHRAFRTLPHHTE